MRAPGKELAVQPPDEPADSFARRRAGIRCRRLGAGEGPQVGRKRARVAVLREAIVDGPLGPEHPALDRHAEPGAADGVPLDAVASKLEVKNSASWETPPCELEGRHDPLGARSQPADRWEIAREVRPCP
jgi:hypothetical protein